MFSKLKLLSPELTGQRRDHVLKILNSGLEAANPRKSIHKHVKRNGSVIAIGLNQYDLFSYKKILVLGIGKAVLEMARGLLDIIGDNKIEGVLVAKHIDQNVDDLVSLGINVFLGDHPVPSERSVNAAQEIIQMAAQATDEDLVICLVSGGGSSLVCMPKDSISLHDIQLVTGLLLSCGADIDEINIVRKRLDRIKGGGLAKLAAPAEIVALIMSDVIGSDPAVIASGPTVVMKNKGDDPADKIIRKYNLVDRIPESVQVMLNGDTVEYSYDEGSDPIQVQNVIISNNYIAAKAAAKMAEREGFNTMFVSSYLRGEASQVGRMLAGILCQIAESDDPIQRPACLIFGGETTVTMKGDGKGGRNLELALGSVMDVQHLQDVALVTLATDGEDGVTDAAGALVTGQTRNRGRLFDLDEIDYLRRNDSYHYFKRMNNLITCGSTGTNVNDLVFLFAFTQPI